MQLLRNTSRMKNVRKHCIQVMAVLILTILSISCTTSPKKDKIKLDWSTFPDPNENVELLSNDVVKKWTDDPALLRNMVNRTVYMPLNYWIKIAEYVADTERNISIIESDLE